MKTLNTFEQKLTALLRRVFPDFERLVSQKQLTAGASQETYRIVYQSKQGEKILALRRSQLEDEESSVGFGSIGLDIESRLFQVAKRHDIPSPEILYTLIPSDDLGAGFMMNWLKGETLGHRITHSSKFDSIRPALARQAGEVLARIHGIDWGNENLDQHLNLISADTLLQKTYQQYQQLNTPQPMVDYTWRWLEDNIPESTRVSLVHADFRNGNLMVNDDGIEAVLDWELAHLGDPHRDIGYLCVNSWRFGNRHLPVGGVGELDDFISAYERVSDYKINRGAVKYWQVFGSFWWAVTTLSMTQDWRLGNTPSLERPVIGRRSSEAQMDCVNLLFPGPFTPPDLLNTSFSQGSQMPMPAELLSGVIPFLKDNVAPELDPRSAYLAKVAANSLQIAQREFLHGPAAAEQEAQRLQGLLGERGDLNELRNLLCKTIQQASPFDFEGLSDHLRQTVATQLTIDQPNYSALKPLGTINYSGDF